ncbi:unnamed protein product, partial [marine sediment metagenome]
DLTQEEINKYKCLHHTENKIIALLKGPGCHLLEGSRGVGKSMLMRIVEIDLDNSLTTNNILSIYVNFKSSPLLENDRFDNKYNSFKIWTIAKILHEFTKKLYKLKIANNTIFEPYSTIFRINQSISFENYLDKKIIDLQKLALTDMPDKRKALEAEIGEDFVSTLNNVEIITNTIKSIIQKTAIINRIIFLFDEAAHAFIPEQQKIFFNIVKLLHCDRISLKIAVYPGITNYGTNFEYGQDAIPIPIQRNDMYSNSSRQENITLFRNLLQKRLGNNKKLIKLFLHD